MCILTGLPLNCSCSSFALLISLQLFSFWPVLMTFTLFQGYRDVRNTELWVIFSGKVCIHIVVISLDRIMHKLFFSQVWLVLEFKGDHFCISRSGRNLTLGLSRMLLKWHLAWLCLFFSILLLNFVCLCYWPHVLLSLSHTCMVHERRLSRAM